MAYFKKLDNGKWQVKFYCKNHKGENNQIKKQGFNTKKEAQDYVNDYLSKNKGSTKIILSTLIEDYKNYKKSIVKLNTFKLYEYYFKIILDNIENKEISKYTKNDFKMFLLSFKDNPKKQKMIKKYFNLLINYGIDFFGVKENLLKNIETSKIYNRKEYSIWTIEEFKYFDSNLKNIKAKAFFNILYYTGARPGEVCALTLNDIDLENKTIHINKTRLDNNTINTPKTKSSQRIISIPDNAINILKKYIIKLPKLNDNFIFTSPHSYRVMLSYYLKKYNLKYISLHGFRHSHASLLIKKGVPITDISKRLGHATPNITLGVYSHFYKEDKDNVIDLLNNL
ncbi:site-specific integrase [Streptobacillus moniliformis]|uniref:site-specific integrase n=1 Tax=Streptobacillus moniliformis TaxID=34105 RepID=UPI0007E37D75|nr:site-specific integrase [Streptobacillus moniliformis]QXW65619.1 tyrosine-type recombinase/integrase [Streptobacillus moniliformis]